FFVLGDRTGFSYGRNRRLAWFGVLHHRACLNRFVTSQDRFCGTGEVTGALCRLLQMLRWRRFLASLSCQRHVSFLGISPSTPPASQKHEHDDRHIDPRPTRFPLLIELSVGPAKASGGKGGITLSSLLFFLQLP